MLRHPGEVQAPFAPGKRARSHDHPSRGERASGLRGCGGERGHQAACARHQAGLLWQPHRAFRAAVPVELLREQLPVLPLSRQEPRDSAPQAHARRDSRRGHRAAGHGPQAPGHRGGRGSEAQPHRVHPGVDGHHLFHQAQKRRHPPREREHRRHDGGRVPHAQEGRDRHVYPVPGNVQQGGLQAPAPDGAEKRLQLAHRGDGPRDGGRHRRRGLGRAVRARELSLRVRGPHHARGASGGPPRRGPAHHQRAAREARHGYRPRRVRQRHSRRDVREDHRAHPHHGALHGNDHLHAREPGGAGARVALRHQPDFGREPNERGRLHRAGAPARHRAVRRERPAHARRRGLVADRPGACPQLLHGVLPRGAHG